MAKLRLMQGATRRMVRPAMGRVEKAARTLARKRSDFSTGRVWVR